MMKGAEWKRPSVTVRAPKVSFKLAHCRNHRASALRRALAQYTQASNPAAFGSLAMPQQPQPQPQPPAAPAAVGRTGTSTAAERERPRPEPERGRPAPNFIGERARRARVRVSCRGCRCGGRCGGRCGPEWRARAAGASVRAQGGGRAHRGDPVGRTETTPCCRSCGGEVRFGGGGRTCVGGERRRDKREEEAAAGRPGRVVRLARTSVLLVFLSRVYQMSGGPRSVRFLLASCPYHHSTFLLGFSDMARLTCIVHHIVPTHPYIHCF